MLVVIFQFTNENHDRSLRSTADNLLNVLKPNWELYRTSLAQSFLIPFLSMLVSQFNERYLQWVEAVN